MDSDTKKIYRFKFTDCFLGELINFASTHRYDEPELFRSEWDKWIATNSEIIARENQILLRRGFKGDILKKMYTSVRYYFKNKSLEKTENKKRDNYNKTNKEIIKLIDNHIVTNGINNKPSELYKHFIDNNKHLINTNDELKLKKTYKNRCYLKQSKMED